MRADKRFKVMLDYRTIYKRDESNMAFSYHFNIEPLALKIAKEHVHSMFDLIEDEEDAPFLDLDSSINNMEHGFLAVTMLCCYVEGTINSILCNALNYENRQDFISKVEDKIDTIAKHFNQPTLLNDLKKTRGYNSFVIIRNIRDELIHYKKSFVGYSGGVPDIMIGKHKLSDELVRSQMIKHMKRLQEMCGWLAEKCNLTLNEDVQIITFDGMDGAVTYIG